jgi:hypothetical protein
MNWYLKLNWKRALGRSPPMKYVGSCAEKRCAVCSAIGATGAGGSWSLDVPGSACLTLGEAGAGRGGQ